jgi:hypothetical protein
MRRLAVGIVLGAVLTGCGDRGASARELCEDLVHLEPTFTELRGPAAGTSVADLRADTEKVVTILDDVEAMTDRLSQRVRDEFWTALTSYKSRLEGVSDDRTVGEAAGPRIGTAGNDLFVAAGRVRSTLGCGS